MSLRTAVLGIGPAGSGKTTMLQPLAAKYGLKLLCPKRIRQELTGDALDQRANERVWQLVYWQVAALLPEHDVLVDATLCKSWQRRELVKLCRDHGAKRIIGVWFQTPYDVCVRWNRSRDAAVPDYAVERMARDLQLNPPSEHDGFDRLITCDPHQVGRPLELV